MYRIEDPRFRKTNPSFQRQIICAKQRQRSAVSHKTLEGTKHLTKVVFTALKPFVSSPGLEIGRVLTPARRVGRERPRCFCNPLWIWKLDLNTRQPLARRSRVLRLYMDSIETRVFVELLEECAPERSFCCLVIVVWMSWLARRSSVSCRALDIRVRPTRQRSVSP